MTLGWASLLLAVAWSLLVVALRRKIRSAIAAFSA
jgi:hypothetical protein